MKRYIQLFTLGAFLVGGLTSCNDFLDREPLDKVTPENFFSSEEELAAYAINNYNFETVDGSYGLNFFGKDNDTDNQVSGGNNSFWVPGNKKVPSDEGYWSSSSSKQWSWRNIRSCNYFFEQVLPRYEAGSILGNHDNVKHYIGEMYVIRAYNYYKMLYNKLIYTGVSRAKKTLTIIGDASAFVRAVNNNYSQNRKTTLKDKILEVYNLKKVS